MAIRSDNCDIIAGENGQVPRDLSGLPTGVRDDCMICMGIPVPKGTPGSIPFNNTYVIKKLVHYNSLFKCKECKDGNLEEITKPCDNCQESIVGTNPKTGLPVTKITWEPKAPFKLNGVAQDCTKCINSGSRKGQIIDECQELQNKVNSNPLLQGKYQYVCEQREGRDAQCYRTCTNRTCSNCEKCVRSDTTGNDTCTDKCRSFEVCYDRVKDEEECKCRKVAYLLWGDVPEADKPYFDPCDPATPGLRDNCECICNCPKTNFDCLYNHFVPFDKQYGGCKCAYYDNNGGNVEPPWQNSKPCGDAFGKKKKIVITETGCTCEDYTAGIQSLLNISLDFIP